MTTTGRTTLCSSKRVIAAGSASRTLVSSTYVRRPWELATQTPLGAGTGPAPRQDTDVSDGPGLAPKRAAPALLSVRPHATRVARRSEGLPGNGAAPSTTTEGTRVPVTAKAPHAGGHPPRTPRSRDHPRGGHPPQPPPRGPHAGGPPP